MRSEVQEAVLKTHVDFLCQKEKPWEVKEKLFLDTSYKSKGSLVTNFAGKWSSRSHQQVMKIEAFRRQTIGRKPQMTMALADKVKNVPRLRGVGGRGGAVGRKNRRGNLELLIAVSRVDGVAFSVHVQEISAWVWARRFEGGVGSMGFRLSHRLPISFSFSVYSNIYGCAEFCFCINVCLLCVCVYVCALVLHLDKVGL